METRVLAGKLASRALAMSGSENTKTGAITMPSRPEPIGEEIGVDVAVAVAVAEGVTVIVGVGEGATVGVRVRISVAVGVGAGKASGNRRMVKTR